LLHPDDIGQWHFVIDVFSKVPLPSGTETRRPTTLTDPRKLEKDQSPWERVATVIPPV
jgi:hypothetical protein